MATQQEIINEVLKNVIRVQRRYPADNATRRAVLSGLVYTAIALKCAQVKVRIPEDEKSDAIARSVEEFLTKQIAALSN